VFSVYFQFDRHVKRSSAGFNVFWRKASSDSGYERIAVIGDGVQEHVLTDLAENTSYIIQVEVYFSKHTLPKSNEVQAITGTRDEGEKCYSCKL